MDHKSLVSVALLSCLICTVQSARILGLFPFEGRSHFVMFEALMKGLAEKGHEVVVVSHWPQKKPLPNYTDRSLVGSRQMVVNSISVDFIEEHLGFWGVMDYIFKEAGTGLCEDIYPHPVIQDLINGNEKFDLMINELWGSDCFLPLAYKLNIPHISMTTTVAVPWAMARYGNPLNPAYETTYFTHFKTSGMNFVERVLNTLMTHYLNIRHYLTSEIPSDAIARKYLGPSIPPLREIITNSSLMMINSHFSVNHPRPFLPNVVEVGGLHIPKPKPLPEEFQKLLDNSKNGVILLSLGSLIQLESFDEYKIQAILTVFKSLPYDILWKFGGNLGNLPKNVKIVKWLPQSDILRHPKIKLFITHGGLMGTQEALLGGVPMLVMPFFGDQKFNTENYVDLGVAEKLLFQDLNRDVFSEKINKILNNKSYEEKSKLISQIFKDRPQSALETAIYWTEYIIRYKGAPHLKSAVKKLNCFQSSLIDVYTFLLLTFLVVVYVVSKILVGLLKLLGLKRKIVKKKVQ